MKQSIKSLIKKNISGEWGNDPIDDNAIKVIRTANFTNSGVLNLENIVLRNIDREKVEQKKLFKGDLIIEKSGGSPTQPVGRVVYFDEDDLFLTNNFTSILRPKIEIVYPKYFFYALFNLHKKGKTLKYQNKTTGIINLKLQDYLLEEILLPTYENQIRIAYLLEKIETTIVERKKAIDLLDELVESTFYQMFGDPVKNEKGWSKDNFKKNGSFKNGLNFKSTDTGQEYKFIGVGDFKNNWKLDNRDNISRISIDEKPSRDFFLEDNDLLFVRSNGNKNLVGRCIIVYTNSEPILYSGFCIRFRLNDISALNPIYIVNLFRNNSFKNSSFSFGRGANIQNINQDNLGDIQIPLPPISLQNQFADIAQKIENTKAEQEDQLKYLEELYASVSHKVFKGDIDLSKVPFDASLLPSKPSSIEISEEEPIDKPDVIVKQELPKQEIKKVIKPIKSKLTWEKISFKEVADYIQLEFKEHYFNAEMLLRYLREDVGIVVNYFSSAEQKKKLQYESADDFYRFIATALTGENHFLTLEQVFYNAETENIPNISFTETDLENLSKKDKNERSGIYFRIKDETTTP